MQKYESQALIEASPRMCGPCYMTSMDGRRWDSGVIGVVYGRLQPGEKLRIRSSAAPGRVCPG